MPATDGDLQIVSIGTSLRNWAFGFFAPFLWFFHAMRASTCFSSASSTPYFLAYAGASKENVAGAVMMQMGTAPSVIQDEIQSSGTVYNLTPQQTRDLRAVGMPPSLINQMQLTYQRAVRRNPQLATSGRYWTQVDSYWYGGIPLGWPHDWVYGAPAAEAR